MGFRQWVREHFVTSDAVYGLILYSALVAGVSDKNSNALEVLVFAVASLVIFWGAHVFAGTVAGHGAELGLGGALRRALGHSSGMLYAAILPSLALLFGVFGLLGADDAVNVALLVATVVLGVLGYYAFSQRKRPVVIRVLGGLGTALFGLLMILLNILVH
ncbi:hypothetical protein BH11ACT4_BH11ACT4_00950 [soil metagenome]